MADTQSGGQVALTNWQMFTDTEKSTFLMWTLFSVGVLLVAFSSDLGHAVVQNCGANGNCSWSPEQADQAVWDCRSLGEMAFAAGLVERLVIYLRVLARSAA